MTTPSNKPGGSSFSTFGLGVAFGIAAAFLFGTPEGRKLFKKALDSIPEKYKKPLESSSHSIPLITPEETQHHAVFDPGLLDSPSHVTTQNHFGGSLAGESPPPPAPHVRPTHPEPFTPSI